MGIWTYCMKEEKMKAAMDLHVPSSCQSPIVYTFYLADNPAPPAVWKAVLLSRLPAGISAWKPEITNGSPVTDWEKTVFVNLFWMGSVLNNASAIACFVWLTDWLLALLQGHCYWAVHRRSWWETGNGVGGFHLIRVWTEWGDEQEREGETDRWTEVISHTVSATILVIKAERLSLMENRKKPYLPSACLSVAAHFHASTAEAWRDFSYDNVLDSDLILNMIV